MSGPKYLAIKIDGTRLAAIIYDEALAEMAIYEQDAIDGAAEPTLDAIMSKYPTAPIFLGSYDDRALLTENFPGIADRMAPEQLDAATVCLLQPALAVHGETQPVPTPAATIRFAAQQLRDARAMLRRLPPRKVKR